jgi:hypothetical protein
MPTTLTAHEQPISRIFSNDYVFKIPPYQRPYAWTTEEAGELFDDLVDFMKTRPGEVEDMPPYFLGSIVLIKPENFPDADVVDGQQRLTTLTLLLSAIRANVEDRSGADITQLLYEKGSQILGTQDRFRLSLRDRDRDFFQKFVQRESGLPELQLLAHVESDSQRNLRDNARLFDERLKGLSEFERLNIVQFIVTRCYLVVVATPDLNSAYRIFSVLNTRGLDLSATDILKAQIVGAIPEAKRQKYTEMWEDIEENLGRDSFGELFAHIRMVYRKAKPQGTLLGEFKEHVLNGMDPIKFIDEVLIPMSDVYEELVDESYTSTDHAKHVNEYLRWLNRLEFNDWMPPALAFAVRWRNRPEMMEQFFRDLERLAYCLLIIKAGINERMDRFSRLTRSIEGNDNLFIEQSPLQLSSIEQYGMFSVLSGPIYVTLSARARSLVLLRLDALVSGGGASYDYPTITVEHVLPQFIPADSQWLAWFPDPEVRAASVHILGNLLLLTRKKNSSASNYEFAHKKEAYFARGGVSPFALTTQVLQHDIWNREVVMARQATLLATLEDYWRLQDRKDPIVEREVIAVYEGDGTWRDDVREALRRLGGRGALYRIYDEVHALRQSASRSIPRTFEAVVRRTLEENSTDSGSYRGSFDLFYMPEGKGAGVWPYAIRNENRRLARPSHSLRSTVVLPLTSLRSASPRTHAGRGDANDPYSSMSFPTRTQPSVRRLRKLACGARSGIQEQMQHPSGFPLSRE